MSQVTLYTRAPNSSTRYVTTNTTFNLTVDARLQFVSGGAGSSPITSATVPANTNSMTFWVKRVNAHLTPYNTTVVVNAP